MVCLVSRIPIFGLFAGMNVYITKISPNILVWEFCGKAQFSQSFGRMAWNCTEAVPHHKIPIPEN